MPVCFDAPDLAPVIVSERTQTGWRGLTADGEILNCTRPNGAPVELPERVAIVAAGETIGYRAMPPHASDGTIDRYTGHLRASSALTRTNEHVRALDEIDNALSFAHTTLARYNRSMILLALGRWDEGFEEFAHCEQTSPLFMRPQYRAAIESGLTPWQGQDIAGKKLLLIHDHGFGDSLMMLRHVPTLHAMGAMVALQMPPELARLAAQWAPVERPPCEADYICSILLLMQFLPKPQQLAPEPYLTVDPALVAKWEQRLGSERKRTKRIGVAWSVGRNHDGDYPRAVPLAMLCRALGQYDNRLISVQQQGTAEADMLGVEHFQFEDFADCAALMWLLDEIVTVDTAAVHLAGAIGHPKISLLLSHWSSWRWQAPLYRNLALCRQDSPGDWESALAKREPSVRHGVTPDEAAAGQ